MKARNLVTGTGRGATINQGERINVRRAGRSRPRMQYPRGSIGADLPRRNYVRYLTERYHRFREADAGFGRKPARPFSYAVLFKNIEARFKSPTYFVPAARFGELVEFLQRKVDGTVIGKRNRAMGRANYDTFDEYQLSQADHPFD